MRWSDGVFAALAIVQVSGNPHGKSHTHTKAKAGNTLPDGAPSGNIECGGFGQVFTIARVELENARADEGWVQTPSDDKNMTIPSGWKLACANDKGDWFTTRLFPKLAKPIDEGIVTYLTRGSVDGPRKLCFTSFQAHDPTKKDGQDWSPPLQCTAHKPGHRWPEKVDDLWPNASPTMKFTSLSCELNGEKEFIPHKAFLQQGLYANEEAMWQYIGPEEYGHANKGPCKDQPGRRFRLDSQLADDKGIYGLLVVYAMEVQTGPKYFPSQICAIVARGFDEHAWPIVRSAEREKVCMIHK